MTGDTTTTAPDTEGTLPIPPEVLGEIAAHTAVEPTDSVDTLKQCCLVNKSFRDQFQPYIYRFLDIEDDTGSKRKWAGPKSTIKILEAIDRNPKLAAHVKEIWLSLGSDIIAQDPQLPTLLSHLHEVSSLRLAAAAYGSTTVWSDINANLQLAITNICQLSTLHSLQLNSLSHIPVTLIANPNLSILQLVNVHTFSDPDDSTLPNLSSLHALQCIYFATAPRELLYRIVESPTVSENLRSLRLTMLLDAEQTDSPSAVANQFDRPFNLSRLKKLSFLKVRFDVEPLDDHPEFAVIGCFLYLVNQMLNTVDESAPLDKLHLTMADVTHGPLIMQVVSDHWSQLGTYITARHSTDSPSPKQTQMKIKFAPCEPEVELEAVPYIKELMFKAATGLSLILKSADGSQL
ncbi:hypothetical protein EST38_g7982 [Candolleomyces aberdarensis]|uniref:F-box domain-containing protein n=1 Tax=Candolleomyces aberdarensis TaxID=2316362 RepID=A0A4Q2DH65_9AGAR|nr:hypothetical protein EST38_g7982 [Candolleomyces aberdarensis]